MARIAGVNVPDDKHAGISLTYIFGVGRTTAVKVCAEAGVNPAMKVHDLAVATFFIPPYSSIRKTWRTTCNGRVHMYPVFDLDNRRPGT